MRIIVVVAVVFLLTLPFGFYRAYTRKYSLRWFLAIHIPVILVFLARYEAHLSYAFIPVTCAAFTASQYLGGKIGRWWIDRRSTNGVAHAEEAPRQKAPLRQGFSSEP